MKLIWHIIRKDIVRDRWALSLWALLFLGQVSIGIMARNPGQIDQDHFLRLQMGSSGLVVLQVVMGYVLVARFVHADSLIGTTMFWLTRPISPGRLLLAKGLGVLLVFTLLPVLLFLPWWLYCGFGARDVFWCAVDVMGWQLLVIAPAFLVATVTDDLGRVLLWTLLLVIGVFAWIALLQAIFSPLPGRVVGFKGIEAGVMYSKIWLSSLVLIVVSGAIAAHHYLTRRLGRSVGLIVIGLALVVAVGRWVNTNLSERLASLTAPALKSAPGLGDQVVIRFDSWSGTRAMVPAKGRVASEEARLQVLLRATNLPEDIYLGEASGNQTWTWTDGIKLDRGVRFMTARSSGTAMLRRRYSLPEPMADPETQQWYQQQAEERYARMRRAGRRVGRPPVLPAERLGLLFSQNTVPNSFFAKMQAEPPAYRAELDCVLYRPELLAELPIDRESRATNGGLTLHLRRVNPGDEALIMTVPTLTQTGLWLVEGISDRRKNTLMRRLTVMQVNRVTGDVVEGSGGGAIQMMVAGVSVYWSKFNLKSPEVIRNGKPVSKDLHSRDHTFLAVIVDRVAGQFKRAVTTDQFTVSTQEIAP